MEGERNRLTVKKEDDNKRNYTLKVNNDFAPKPGRLGSI